ncbi:Monocarboxylate transporter 9 [Mizuhopecten yessoensis]|uniref:Monocarboxylate transporter 9 n=2 Tax=Mizuhopecten yessoensis TaxID=6573 RepID=A0A210QMP6_MIZYE|nr:Monocarboxylate transporter 9 [Mizuhopecten yessoensis]
MAIQHDTSVRKWLVLVASFFNMFFCAGFPFNMSVLNTEFLRVFERSKAETALVQSVISGTLLIAGYPCGQSVNRFGVRKMGILSGLLASVGLSVSFFATSIPYLVITVGIITGLGLSLAFVASTTATGEYFTGNARHLALSFVACGSGCGSMVFPYLLDRLISVFGWRGCLLIVGGLMANMIWLFAICKPLTVGLAQSKYVQSNKSNLKPHQINDTGLNTSNGHTHCCMKLVLLSKSYDFIIYILGMTCTFPAFICILIYIIEFLKTKSFDSEEALLLYLFMNVANTLGRMIPGLCKYIPHVSSLVIPALTTIISCISTVGLLFANTYKQHLLLMCGFGLAIGSNVTVMSMTTIKLVGLANYSVGVGILMTVTGVSSVCAGTISGWLLDLTGTYTVAYYSAAASHGVAVCLFCLAALIRKHNQLTSDKYHLGDSVDGP